MKFFKILISSFLFLNWAFLDDVQGIPEPSHQLYSQYSKLHIQLPKNDDPSISCLILGTLAEEALMSDLLISSQEHLYSVTVDTQYEYDHCSQLLVIYVHSLYHILESKDHDICISNLLLIHGNNILLPTQYDNLTYLWYENFFDKNPHNKSKIFIETKVTAIKLQGFNL